MFRYRRTDLKFSSLMSSSAYCFERSTDPSICFVIIFLIALFCVVRPFLGLLICHVVYVLDGLLEIPSVCISTCVTAVVFFIAIHKIVSKPNPELLTNFHPKR